MNIENRFNTVNTTESKNRGVRWIVIHYNAGVSSKPGSAYNDVEWYKNPAAQCSADYVVDDEKFVCTNPDIINRKCWSVGGGKYNTSGGRLYGVVTNANSISIEMCANNKTGKMTYPNDPNYYLTDATVKNAIELCKYLMKQWGIDSEHVIRHYDVNGKECPGVIGWNAESGSESKWNEFKRAISGQTSESKEFSIDGVTASDLARVVMAEFGMASGKNYNCLLGVAQCIKDMYDSKAYGKTMKEVLKNFTSPASNYTQECYAAILDVFVNGVKRFQDYRIYQFRSFSKYSDGNGNVDNEKCKSLLEKYEYLGADAINNQFGHLYFGTKEITYIVQCGAFSVKGNADGLKNRLIENGFDAIVKQFGTEYYVQAGSFTNKDNAENLKVSLIKEGYNAIIK